MTTPPRGPPVFRGLRVHLLPAKCPAPHLEELRAAVVDAGGTLAEVPYVHCDVIATALTSPARVEKHLLTEKLRVPVVREKWLFDCLAKGTRLDLEPYKVPLRAPAPPIDAAAAAAFAGDAPVPRGARKRSADAPDVGDRPPAKKPACTSDESTSADDDDLPGDDDEDTTDDERGGRDPIAPGYVNTKFACFNPCPVDHFNAGLVEELAVIEHARELMGEARSALSYRRAIAALKGYPRDVASPREALAIENIGSKIANMVKEYLRTGRIAEADLIREDPRFEILDDFMDIYGVGAATARQWYAAGHRSVDDVVANAHLSEVQLAGVKYYNDFKQKLTRPQVEAIVETVTEGLKTVDGDCVIDVVGGYRRGKPLSGDVDIVVSSPEESKARGLLDQIVRHFRERGNILHVLGLTAGHAEDRVAGSSSGMDALDKALVAWKEEGDPYVRRVDIIVPPWSQRVCAILGWTGSRQYERALRDYAQKKAGYRLSSHALLDLATREAVPVRDEAEIFAALRVPHFPPELRNC